MRNLYNRDKLYTRIVLMFILALMLTSCMVVVNTNIASNTHTNKSVGDVDIAKEYDAKATI